jgi:hypothetical protein
METYTHFDLLHTHPLHPLKPSMNMLLVNHFLEVLRPPWADYIYTTPMNRVLPPEVSVKRLHRPKGLFHCPTRVRIMKMMMGCLPWMGRAIDESMRVERTSNGKLGTDLKSQK